MVFPIRQVVPGSRGIGHLRKGVQTEQVSEEIRTRPDGTVCKCPGTGTVRPWDAERDAVREECREGCPSNDWYMEIDGK